MPISPIGLTGALIGGVSSTGNLGLAVPQLAQGLGEGTFNWLQSCIITSEDVGTLGAGIGTGIFLVPPALLQAEILKAFTEVLIAGPLSSPFAVGLAQGFGIGFPQGLILTASPTVGVGTGVGHLVGPPAFPFLQAGMSGAGLSGQGVVQLATALTLAFANVFASLTFQLAIVGPPSIIASTGKGLGRVV